MATYDQKKLQAFATKVPQGMISDWVDTTSLQKLYGAGPKIPVYYSPNHPLAAADDVFIPTGQSFVDPATLELKQSGYIANKNTPQIPIAIAVNGKPITG